MNYERRARYSQPPATGNDWKVTVVAPGVRDPKAWAEQLPWPTGWRVVHAYNHIHVNRQRRRDGSCCINLTTVVLHRCDVVRTNLPKVKPTIPTHRLMDILEKHIDDALRATSPGGLILASKRLRRELVHLEAHAHLQDDEDTANQLQQRTEEVLHDIRDRLNTERI